jgi:hypothetical protein
VDRLPDISQCRLLSQSLAEGNEAEFRNPPLVEEQHPQGPGKGMGEECL